MVEYCLDTGHNMIDLAHYIVPCHDAIPWLVNGWVTCTVTHVMSLRLDNVHFVVWIGSVELAWVHTVCMELVMVDNVELDDQAWNETTIWF